MDKWDKIAEGLLPCRILDGSRCSGNPNLAEHSEACPAFYRPAVAAKLRMMGEEIERLKDGRNCPRCDSPNPKLHPAMQFEGEVQECSHPFHFKADIERLNADRDAAHLKGLETAGMLWHCDMDTFIKRIDEAKGK